MSRRLHLARIEPAESASAERFDHKPYVPTVRCPRGDGMLLDALDERERPVLVCAECGFELRRIGRLA